MCGWIWVVFEATFRRKKTLLFHWWHTRLLRWWGGEMKECGPQKREEVAHKQVAKNGPLLDLPWKQLDHQPASARFTLTNNWATSHRQGIKCGNHMLKHEICATQMYYLFAMSGTLRRHGFARSERSQENSAFQFPLSPHWPYYTESLVDSSHCDTELLSVSSANNSPGLLINTRTGRVLTIFWKVKAIDIFQIIERPTNVIFSIEYTQIILCEWVRKAIVQGKKNLQSEVQFETYHMGCLTSKLMRIWIANMQIVYEFWKKNGTKYSFDSEKSRTFAKKIGVFWRKQE